MTASSSKYCDFVVWTSDASDPHIERIQFDAVYFPEDVAKATLFYKVGILSELLDKWCSIEIKPETHT